jgi:hypothetical protein
VPTFGWARRRRQAVKRQVYIQRAESVVYQQFLLRGSSGLSGAPKSGRIDGLRFDTRLAPGLPRILSTQGGKPQTVARKSLHNSNFTCLVGMYQTPTSLSFFCFLQITRGITRDVEMYQPPTRGGLEDEWPNPYHEE